MQPLPSEDWEESLDRVLDDLDGQPLKVHSLMANHPRLLTAWWNFRNYCVAGGDLSQRDCELLVLRVAWHMGSWYEWASHVDRGRRAGVTMEEIDRIATGARMTDWPARDGALLASVDELVRDHAISAGTQQRLAAHFSANQVMDIIAVHGMYVTLGCMLNTWALELDERVQRRLPDNADRTTFEQAIQRQQKRGQR